MNCARPWLLGMFLLAAGCTRAAPAPPPRPTFQLFTPAPAASTPTLIPTPVSSPLAATLTAPASTVTSATFTPFDVHPSADAVRLRLGPGELFDALRLVHRTDTLTVHAQAPGGEWIWAEALDETRGWVNRHLIEESPQLQSAPRVDPEDVQLLRGRVSDEVGTPISGIQFSLTLGDLRLDARTDDQGDLYFYLPSDASGDWLVTFVAVGCPSNVFADNTCAGYKPGYTGTVQPDALPVTLPNDGVLAFRWE